MLVPLRVRRVVLTTLLCAVVATIGFRLWRHDFDDDDLSTFVLALILLACWLLAVCVGLLARSLVAGYALRLDADGLHLPGWEVVPWPAIHSAELTRSDWPRDGSLAKLVLSIDGDCRAHRRGSYERWLWGPIAGLRSKKQVTELSLFALAVTPDRLRTSMHYFMGKADAPQARSPRR